MTDEASSGPEGSASGAEPETGSDSDSSSASGSESSQASAGRAAGEAPEPAAQGKGCQAADLAVLGRVLYVHKRYLTLHAAKFEDNGDEPRLVCGLDKERAAEVLDISQARYKSVCLRCLREVAP